MIANWFAGGYRAVATLECLQTVVRGAGFRSGVFGITSTRLAAPFLERHLDHNRKIFEFWFEAIVVHRMRRSNFHNRM